VSLAQAERGFDAVLDGPSVNAVDCDDVIEASLTEASEKGKPSFRRGWKFI
jgi:hypothetical protein